jgi:hypothetical protein
MVFHIGLSYISLRARFYACFDELFFCMHGQKHKYCCGARGSEFVQSINSIQDRHGYVGDDEIRVEAASFRHQRLTIGDCCYDIKMGRQESNLGFEHRSVVIRQYYPRSAQTYPFASHEAALNRFVSDTLPTFKRFLKLIGWDGAAPLGKNLVQRDYD